MSDALDRFDFGNAAETIWRFVWYEFCDWYVEATKAERNRATRAAVLSFVWNNAMRLLHPIAPFISEEVWLALPHDGATIVTATWPDPLEVPVLGRGGARLPVAPTHRRTHPQPARRASASIRESASSWTCRRTSAAARPLLLALFATAAVEASAPAGDGLGGGARSGRRARAPRRLLEERYRKEVERLRSEIERGEKKLANDAFVAKAAPDVVAKEREKLEGYRTELARVEAALRALKEPA